MKISINGMRICYACDRETQTTVTVSIFTIFPNDASRRQEYIDHWMCPACFVDECKFDTRSQGKAAPLNP